MTREVRENGDEKYYRGEIMEDHRWSYARLEVALDCEAELAVLLKSAARKGILRLDRILPFLVEADADAPG
jgi:hypothetical protein